MGAAVGTGLCCGPGPLLTAQMEPADSFRLDLTGAAVVAMETVAEAVRAKIHQLEEPRLELSLRPTLWMYKQTLLAFTNNDRLKSNLRDPHSVSSVIFDPCNTPPPHRVPLLRSFLRWSCAEDDRRPVQTPAYAEDVNKLLWDSGDQIIRTSGSCCRKKSWLPVHQGLQPFWFYF